MLIDDNLLDKVTEQAKAYNSPRILDNKYH